MAITAGFEKVANTKTDNKDVLNSIKEISGIIDMCTDIENEKLNCETCDCKDDCNIKKIVNQVDEKFIKTNKRVMYSEITTKVYNMDPETFDVLVYTLGRIIDYVNKEHGNNDKLKNFFFKLLDHVNLAAKQSETVDDVKSFANVMTTNVITTIRGELEESKKSITSIKKDKDSIYNNMISIVGIFVAISFVMFGGLTLINNLFNYTGVNGVPIVEMLCLGSLIGLVIINAIYAFVLMIFYLVSKHEELQKDGRLKRMMTLLNVVLFSVIVITSVLWWFDVKNTYGYKENTTGCQVIEVDKENNKYILECKGTKDIKKPTPAE